MKPRLILVLGLTMLVPAARAQTWPEKPIRLVVGYAAGGTADIVARLIATPLSSALGQQVIADNRPGAASNIGMELVAKAPPDGYTLLMSTPAISSNPTLYGKVPWDPIASFAPVTLVGEVPVVLVVHPSLPVKSVRELIALAKAQPGELNFGSSGNGGIGHLVGEHFKSMTGIRMTHVPYKGNGPALIDLMAGALDLAFSDLAGASPYMKSGKLRPLAIASAKRSPTVPDLPTMGEAGVPGFQASSWFAVFAPAGTPRPVIDRLNTEIVKVVRAPELRDRMTGLGFDVVAGKPEELGAFLKTEIVKWTKVIKDSGAKVE